MESKATSIDIFNCYESFDDDRFCKVLVTFPRGSALKPLFLLTTTIGSTASHRYRRYSGASLSLPEPDFASGKASFNQLFGGREMI